MKILTLKQAREKGLKKYYNGKKCPKGHISYRYVSTQTCIQCNSDRSAYTVKSRGGPKKRYYIPNDEIMSVALNYKTRSEFQKNSVSHYSAAHRRKILDQACSHMRPSLTKRKWFLCSLIKELHKYETLNQFSKKSSGAYDFAMSSGMLGIVRSNLKADTSGDYDVLYIMSFNVKIEGKRLYKIGVTSDRLGEQRILQNYRSFPVDYSVVLMLNTEIAPQIESDILSTADRYIFDHDFNGSTEFFLASDDELTCIYERIWNAA